MQRKLATEVLNDLEEAVKLNEMIDVCSEALAQHEYWRKELWRQRLENRKNENGDTILCVMFLVTLYNNNMYYNLSGQKCTKEETQSCIMNYKDVTDDFIVWRTSQMS